MIASPRTPRPSGPLRPSRRGPALAALLVAVVAVLAACSSSGVPSAAPPRPTTTAPAAAPATPQPDCGNRVASFAPTGPLPAPGAMPAGTYMDTIQQRGRLIVGASADTFRMGARNPFTGQIEGFDIDQLKRVASAIFPDAVRADGSVNPERVEFKVVTYAQRIPALRSGEVDIVAHSMTINCARWEQIDFSSEYYTAGQKVLVGDKGDQTPTGIEDLAGQRVCTQNGTTSIERLREFPDIEVVAVDDVSDCVVKFQLGEADAISGDDTVLAGFAAQDPYARIVGTAFSTEPYGMGIAKGHPEFVRFVNAVLERSRTDGSWKQSYDTWLSTGPDDTTAPPTAVYGRQP